MEPSKTAPKSPAYVTAIVWAAVGILVLVVLAWVYNFYKQNVAGNTTPKSSPSAIGPLNISPSAKQGQTNASGNWKLSLNGPVKTTGIQTDITGLQTGEVSFQLPNNGGSVEATGTYKVETNGTVGAGTVTGNITGKSVIKAENKNNKLHVTVTLVQETCFGEVQTPIGGQTSNTCDPNPTPYSFDIDISTGATATNSSTQSLPNYTITRNDTWTLNKN